MRSSARPGQSQSVLKVRCKRYRALLKLKLSLVNEKRIAGGWMTYSLIEIKQRYRIPGPLSSNIDHALEMYHLQIRDGFYRAWSKHSCDVSLLFFFLKNLTL